MLKYIIKDLKETLAYLPYGIMAGGCCGTAPERTECQTGA